MVFYISLKPLNPSQYVYMHFRSSRICIRSDCVFSTRLLSASEAFFAPPPSFRAGSGRRTKPVSVVCISFDS